MKKERKGRTSEKKNNFRSYSGAVSVFGKKSDAVSGSVRFCGFRTLLTSPSVGLPYLLENRTLHLHEYKQSKCKAFGNWLDKLMCLGNLIVSPGKSSIILPFSVETSCFAFFIA